MGLLNNCRAPYIEPVKIGAGMNHWNINTVKPVLSRHSNIDKTKILMINGSLMKGQKYCRMLPVLSNILSLKKHFLFIFEWLLKTGFTVFINSLTIWLSLTLVILNIFIYYMTVHSQIFMLLTSGIPDVSM